MHITMVKKIKADGSPCRKCAEVDTRLEEAGLKNKIDQIVIADERDPASEGMQLAIKHKVELAPFFIVKDDNGDEQIYTVYFRFVKEILNSKSSEKDEVAELMEQTDDLDFL